MEEKAGVEQAMPDNEQNITNSDFFKNLSDEEKKLALEILKQYATEGQSDLFEDLKYADFEEIPVDISTFMHDPRYLGKALYDQEGRFTIFPYWEKTLEDIFPDNISTKYNNIVLTGAIGLGKSTIAVICLLYLLYRLLCLKNPYTYYGMQEIDKITISLMNITLDNAKGVALDKMNQMILSSEWFMSHGEMAGSTNLVFHPEKHIEVIVASSNNQIIGRALFANFTDECVDGETVIKTADGDKKIKDLVGKEFKVYSIDEFGKEILSNVCTAKPTKVTNEEYEIELEDGSTIKCTGNHLFMLKDGTYKRADELTEDDELFDTQDTYENFIGRIIEERGQWSDELKNTYCERHHIIPKCMGGLPRRLNWNHHDNVIWLTAKEHFIAHKLLALENPDNYELVTAFKRMCYSNHNDFEVTEDNIELVKKSWAKLHSEKLTGTKHEHHIIKDAASYKKQKSDQCSGSGNPMFGHGELVSGGKNGHATTRYYYDNKTFECRKELVDYLKSFDNKICVSTIRKLERGSTRVLREHKLLSEVRWEAK